MTFSKTVYVAAGSSGSGSLSDVANLTGSDGFTANADASVALSAARQATITILKHIPNVLSGSETASFTFDVVDAARQRRRDPHADLRGGRHDEVRRRRRA